MQDKGKPASIAELRASVEPALALLAGMQLGVFTALGKGELSAQEVAAQIGCDAGRLSRLLYALALVGLLEVTDERFRNGAEAAEVLVAGKPGFIGAAHEVIAKVWGANLNTAESIRTGKPAAEHDFSKAKPEDTAAFLRGLGPGGLAFGRTLAGMLDLSRARSVIDIGGGAGTVLAGLRERWPHLKATLLELPEVIVHAGPILAEHGAGEVALETGDILQGPTRHKHDLAILRAVIQVLSPSDAERAIRHTAQSLNPGGEAIIGGWGILDDDRLGPRSGVFVNLTFLNFYRDGEAYTESQYRGWMKAAGFVGVERSSMPDGTGMFRGRIAV
jgi:SAM-dependent methyltransferase